MTQIEEIERYVIWKVRVSKQEVFKHFDQIYGTRISPETVGRDLRKLRETGRLMSEIRDGVQYYMSPKYYKSTEQGVFL